ncbi:YceI family protein [Woodsholea maritima]|uniref:YceI family protein n=1 Tax=Woodsholea maritima TaxID=240237 RepID=UPI00037D70C3|nr:YceI family protein [Woodsholea maritima]
MKLAYAAASLAAFLTAPALADPVEYQFDKSHTAIRASWTHLGFSTQSLYLTDYDGVLLLDFEEPQNSTIDVTFNLAGGLWTGVNQERFEGHLNSPDLFNTSEFPTARFVASEFATEDGQTGTMTGDLTLLGQTHPVTLNVTLNKHAPNPMSQVETAGFTATGTLTRSEWGLGYAAPRVSDEITLEINTELNVVSE